MKFYFRNPFVLLLIAPILVASAREGNGEASEIGSAVQNKENGFLSEKSIIQSVEYLPNGGEAIVVTDSKKLRGIRQALVHAKVVLPDDTVPSYTAKVVSVR